MGKNATGTQVDQNREDDAGRISQAQSNVQSKDTKSIPRKWRKKPVVIEAIQFVGTLENAQQIGKWAGHPFDWHGNHEHMMIPTLEGKMTADKGDYIIRGVHGEYYPCKPDIFLETYEEVSDMITDNPDTNSRPSESPSSRPMTLRQQLEVLDIGGGFYLSNEAIATIEAMCQEIAREAVDTALKTERKAVLGYSNDMKIDRALALAEKSGYEKCEAYHKRKAELTQKPPHYPNGRDEPCEICGDGGHTEIACTNLSEESETPKENI